MKNKRKPSVKNKNTVAPPGKSPFVSPAPPLSERLEAWLSRRRKASLGILVLCWVLIRVFMFDSVANGPLYRMYEWKESDSAFFDDWACSLAAGDWLNQQPLHPYHGWHREFADYFFDQHPEKRNEILAANPNRTSNFEPGKSLWNQWYGGNTYHQEPLYAYLLAVLYWLSGNGVYWMLLLQSAFGVGSGVLLWSIARRYFGDTVAVLTGLLYLFCGTILFQEMLVLRTSWSVFFALLLVWTLDRALDRRTTTAFLLHGISIGLAVLMQSVFLLFLPVAPVIYFVKMRKVSKPLVRNIAALGFGLLLIISPLVLRNGIVGVPLFSISSVGPITFITANVYGTKTIASWRPDAPKCAAIMDQSRGKLGAAVLGAMQTHPGAGTYFSLLGEKLGSALDGTEWPNNENYYFYKSMVPALQIAFLNSNWLIWCAVTGILFTFFYRKKCPALYLAVLLQLAILLGFYVLGRFRTPLVALFLPFAAYALVECLQFAKEKRRIGLAKIAVAVLCFYFLSWRNYRPDSSMLDPTDYAVFYEIVYNDRVVAYTEAQEWDSALALHTAFLQSEPKFIRQLKPGQRLKSPNLVETANLFAYHFQMQSDLYAYSGNTVLAEKANRRYVELGQLVQESRRYGGR